ncbi:MAG: hypothetical protein HY925_00720 [Elusimicrobia bacterium]|nr:hypothetical protein [Elusimicrobiota bacterium]
MTGWVALLLAAAVQAQVRVSVTPAVSDPVRLAAVEAALRPMLQAPKITQASGRLVLESPSWAFEPGRRSRALQALKAEWGDRLRVEEGSLLPPLSPVVAHAPRISIDPAILERLRRAPRLESRDSQDAFYDRNFWSGEPETVSAARSGGTVRLVSAHATGPQVVREEPPAPEPKAPENISWGRAALEVGKGALGVVKNVFTWKGAAVVAGSLALVTLAPVTIYGLLVLGAATSGWQIGKSLVQGYQAHQEGDAAKFYEASRGMGQGLLTLGLSLLGSRHPPTSFKPHFPKTRGEWQAFAAAMDDEPLVIMSLTGGGKAHVPAAPASARAPERR